SVTASTAYCAARASSNAPAFRREMVAWASSPLSFPLPTALSSWPRMSASPFWTRSGATSIRMTSMPLCAATCAIPAPVCPALADAAGVERSVHRARCPPQVAHALDLGRLAPSELWCADVPLSVESDAAGMLRLVLDKEPRRSLLRALRGVGHEASLQLAQER